MPQLTKDKRVCICIEYAGTNNGCDVIRRWTVTWHGIQQQRNITELREAIVSACEFLDQQMIQNAFDDMIFRPHAVHSGSKTHFS